MFDSKTIKLLWSCSRFSSKYFKPLHLNRDYRLQSFDLGTPQVKAKQRVYENIEMTMAADKPVKNIIIVCAGVYYLTSEVSSSFAPPVEK
mmetsp:Transcript_19575/g.33966  ORF Transcript_19575/g.33966 Transcript_19575/m.33966 type:complete len:90 (+) Transcript_19575:257-526(+)